MLNAISMFTNDFFRFIFLTMLMFAFALFHLLCCIINHMIKEKILVIGASGQIGVELTLELGGYMVVPRL